MVFVPGGGRRCGRHAVCPQRATVRLGQGHFELSVLNVEETWGPENGEASEQAEKKVS